MLRLLGADESTQLRGLGRYDDGRLDGTLVEMEAVRFAQEPFLPRIMGRDAARAGLKALARTVHRAGVTTTADMGLGLQNFDDELEDHLELVNAHEFRLRMPMTCAEIAMNARHRTDGARFVQDLSRRSTDKLRFHGIEIWLDGSYQAMALRVNRPGYLDAGLNLGAS